jgi:hypothetical protein
MPLEIPNLDDRRWADLVEEARALIPRLAPRWTDHNVHDPGITFIELFAWLAEMQIYQLNRVGERHRELFGRLAGVERRRRTPARVDVFVTGTLPTPLTLPAATQLTPLEGDELVFETVREVTLTRSQLRQVIVDDGSGPIDQTDANTTSRVTFLAFGERAQQGAELRLGFDAFYPGLEPRLRLTLDVYAADLLAQCGPYAPVTPDDAAGADTPVAPVDVQWEYLAAGGRWLPLAVESDETAVLSRSGTITLAVPDAAVRDRGLEWIRSRIVRGHYDIEPRLRQLATNVLPCVQQETVRDEQLGHGNGLPDQEFALAKGPMLIAGSGPAIEIEVGGDLWEQTPALDEAGPASRAFVFDPEGRRVLFGNGLNGQVPTPGQDIRARWYVTSAGAAGNVAKGLTWKFRTRAVPGVSLTNPSPASDGADPEALGEMELRARALLARSDRAVTLSDIERLALGTPYVHVARAHAIANCPSPERITVIAVPKVRPGRVAAPLPPSNAFLDAVRRHLDERRLLCDNLRVVAPVYLEVRVTAHLRLEKGAGPAAALRRASQALDRFLRGEDALAIGDTPRAEAATSPCPTRWPFGRSVFPSDIYAVLDRVAGVDAASDVVLTGTRDAEAIAPDDTGAIAIPRTGLVLAGRHQLVVDTESRGRT